MTEVISRLTLQQEEQPGAGPEVPPVHLSAVAEHNNHHIHCHSYATTKELNSIQHTTQWKGNLQPEEKVPWVTVATSAYVKGNMD